MEFCPPPTSYDRIPDRHACGRTKGPVGTARVLRSGKAHRSPTPRVSASRASPDPLQTGPLMGSTGCTTPRTQ